MKIILTIFFIAALLYCLLLIAAKFFAASLMFQPPARTYVKTAEHKTFAMPDGTELTGLFLQADKPVCNLFYCHGNGEDLGVIYPLLNEFRKRGISVFSYDYPGYGYSYKKIKPSEKKLYESADAAWKFASQKLGFSPENTVLMGFSLGSAPVSLLGSKIENWRGIILAGGLANGVKTVLPIDIIPWKILDNASKVSKIKSPLLLIHGTRDFIVAPHNAKENFAAAKCPKQLVWLEGFYHNDIPSSPEYWNSTMSFINKK